MDYVQLIGILAGTLTTIAFLPQVIKTWRTKSAKGLSLGMFSVFCTGVSLWLIYGFLIHDLPMILANIITLVLAITLLVFKFRFKD
jgi:MtN3 and saliva related transmembrane protein